MTVLLMLCMIVTFLVAENIVRKIRAVREQRAAFSPAAVLADPPEGVALALNHTWMKVEKGIATIGVDEFLARMLGAVESVIVPDIGATVATSAPSIALAHGNRKVRLSSPVAGRIMDVNRGVLRDPRLARSDPYGNGWLLKVSPSVPPGSASGTYTGAARREWLRAQLSLAREFLTGSAPGIAFGLLPDGGELVEGVLQQCDAATWEAFERRFTTLQAFNPANT